MTFPIIDDGVFNPILERRVAHWQAVGPFKAARFEFPRIGIPGYFEVVHPSTDEPGKWRVSRFDDRGAVGHACYPTAQEAIEGLEYGAVLVKVVM